MQSSYEIPDTIRHNNPGALRAAQGLNQPIKRFKNIVSFPTIDTGLLSLCHSVSSLYTDLGKKTLPEFLAAYTDTTRSDLLAYETDVARRLLLNPLKVRNHDLKLSEPWPAFDMIRALIIAESGRACPGWHYGSEWCSPAQIICAMTLSRCWLTI